MSVKDDLGSLLNSSAFSTDSIEGWLLIFLITFLVYNISKKAMKFIKWTVSCIIIVQLCYWLSMTGLNDIIPLGDIFKYDLLTAIAQCFVNTKLCDILLYINAFFKTICFEGWKFISNLLNSQSIQDIKDIKGSISS